MSDTHAAWETLVTNALLGTDRQAFALPTVEGSWGNLITQVDVSDSPRGLLNTAALLSLHSAAGKLSEQDTAPIPEPCAPEDRPECTPQLAALGNRLFKGGPGGTYAADVIREYLLGLNRRGERLPEELVFDCLKQFSSMFWYNPSTEEKIESIRKALGRRGRWLAAKNEQWKVFADNEDAADDAIWKHGEREARIRLMQTLRRTDPTHARELLSATFRDEPARDRNAFLETFEVGLSMADEPFLEAQLDDPSALVRHRISHHLLPFLSESRFCERMIERARALVTLFPGDPPRIEARLPQTFTPDMKRDGIEYDKKRPIDKQASTWLIDIIGAIPPEFWEKEWHMMPAEILGAAERSKGKRGSRIMVLLDGWHIAVERYRAVSWIEAAMDIGLTGERWVSLRRYLPQEKLESYALALIPTAGLESVFLLLNEMPSWGEALFRVVWEKMGSIPKTQWFRFHTGYQRMAARVEPTHWFLDALRALEAEVLQVDTLTAAGQRTTQSELRNAIDLLEVRLALHEALAAPLQIQGKDTNP